MWGDFWVRVSQGLKKISQINANLRPPFRQSSCFFSRIFVGVGPTHNAKPVSLSRRLIAPGGDLAGCLIEIEPHRHHLDGLRYLNISPGREPAARPSAVILSIASRTLRPFSLT